MIVQGKLFKFLMKTRLNGGRARLEFVASLLLKSMNDGWNIGDGNPIGSCGVRLLARFLIDLSVSLIN